MSKQTNKPCEGVEPLPFLSDWMGTHETTAQDVQAWHDQFMARLDRDGSTCPVGHALETASSKGDVIDVQWVPSYMLRGEE